MDKLNLRSIEHHAAHEIASLFENAGWRVDREPRVGPLHADLAIAKGRHAYIAEIKATSEGRPDRVLALLSQAILQAKAYAREERSDPLAIVWVGTASPALLSKVDAFIHQFARDVAIGIVSNDGVRHFVGPGLQTFDAKPPQKRKAPGSSPRQIHNLFSDLNQWMLKVLIAPEVPEHFLTAPRGEYRNVSELASAANVSLMSAFRFATRLREEGFLDEAGSYLRLVRRAELFRRWQSAVGSRSSPETPMRFVIPGAGHEQLRKLLSRHQACLGLFAAADALGLGHVSGVPPYVYTNRTSLPEKPAWKELIPAAPGEPPHLIVKQPLAPHSLFRGAVAHDGFRVTDVLQIWIDVSSHPSRGMEQADWLRRKVLQNIVGEAA